MLEAVGVHRWRDRNGPRADAENVLLPRRLPPNYAPNDQKGCLSSQERLFASHDLLVQSLYLRLVFLLPFSERGATYLQRKVIFDERLRRAGETKL